MGLTILAVILVVVESCQIKTVTICQEEVRQSSDNMMMCRSSMTDPGEEETVTSDLEDNRMMCRSSMTDPGEEETVTSDSEDNNKMSRSTMGASAASDMDIFGESNNKMSQSTMEPEAAFEMGWADTWTTDRR